MIVATPSLAQFDAPQCDNHPCDAREWLNCRTEWGAPCAVDTKVGAFDLIVDSDGIASLRSQDFGTKCKET